MGFFRSAKRQNDLLKPLAPEEERALWEVRLETETPQQRVQTAREHLLDIAFYGYDRSTGHDVKRKPHTLN